MNRFAISTPEGTRDRLFASCRAMRQSENIISNLLEGRGYREVTTPTTEYYDVFLQAESSIPQESMLMTTDRSGRLMVLRPDSTMPIARMASTKLSRDALPLRMYYRQSVFRVNASGSGHLGEIMQIGAELIGSQGIMADLDILSAAFETMRTVGDQLFRIELGHAGIYKALISQLGADEYEAEEIRRLIESKSFAALSDRLEPYRSSTAYSAIKAMPQLFGGAEVLDEAAALTDNPQALSAIDYLRRIYNSLQAAGYGEYIMIDLGLVHELDYYTGIMFQGYMGGAGKILLSGGRYDQLCSKFGADLPAIGFAIDLDGVSQLIDPGEDNSRRELVLTDEHGLMAALAYVSGHDAALAPCDSEEEALKLAKNEGYRAIIKITGGGMTRKAVE